MTVEQYGPYYEGIQQGYTEGIGVATKTGNTFSLDLATGNVFDLTLTANSTVVLTQRSTVGTCYSFIIVVRQSGGPWTLTGPASFKYPGGSAPTYSANTVNLITAVTVDGGTNYLVSAAGFNYA